MNDNLTPPRRRGRPPKRSPHGRQFAQVTVQLDPELVVALDAHAEAGGASRSELIRTACREHLRRAAKRTEREAAGAGGSV